MCTLDLEKATGRDDVDVDVGVPEAKYGSYFPSFLDLKNNIVDTIYEW